MFLNAVIGLNLLIWEIELFLFTMSNKKLLLNQLIESEPITLILITLMSIPNTDLISLTSKENGSMSILLIPLLSMPSKPGSDVTEKMLLEIWPKKTSTITLI